jgi:hypothetical protein
MINDMPKLHSPFVRKMIDKRYVVTPEIDEDFKWVFEDDEVIATEKLDGTNVSIIIENGKVTRVFNRKNEIQIFGSKQRFIIEGVMNAFDRGYCNFTDGQYFGEVIGPKLQKNPLGSKEHLWIPFEKVRKSYSYKSWGKYPKDFDNISTWFKDDLFSLFVRQRSGKVIKPEGIVFYQPSTGKMAKLRVDMFDWFEGKRHRK